MVIKWASTKRQKRPPSQDTLDRWRRWPNGVLMPIWRNDATRKIARSGWGSKAKLHMLRLKAQRALASQERVQLRASWPKRKAHRPLLPPNPKKQRVVHNIIYKPWNDRFAKTAESELQRQKDFERSHNRKLSLKKLQDEVDDEDHFDHGDEAYRQRLAAAEDMTEHWYDRPEALDYDYVHTPDHTHWSAPHIPHRRLPYQPGRFPPRAYRRWHEHAEDRLNKAHNQQARWRFDYFTKHKKTI